jgi:hypothetical protein
MNDIELREEQPESVTILIDQPTPIDPHEKAREEAFDATFQWKGQDLGPFTSGRRREWMRLKLIDGPDPTLVGDAIKIIWLCLTHNAKLLARRSNPEALIAEIWEWAEENVGGLDENEAIVKLADQVLIASESTRAVPIPSNGAESGN